MSATPELDDLLGLLADGLLDEAGTARLENLLVADPGARRRYRRFMALHSALRWDYASVAREQLPAPLRRSAPRRRWAALAAAIAATLVAAVALGQWSARSALPQPIITVSEITGGSLTWSDGASEQRVLADGERLSAGQFVLEGGSASATLRFADGTTLGLSGDSELAVGEDGSKHLHLSHGALSADVRPQPAAHPLLVRTDTAELVVVGTLFTVTSTTAQTALEVEHGMVRLQRLADGQSVEVAAQQRVVASLDVASALRCTAHARPPTSWTLDLAHQPPAHWRGTWVRPDGAQPGFLRAVPYVAARTPQGAPIVHHGVEVDAMDGPNLPFVRFVAGTRLTLRFRVARPDGRVHLAVMVCTHTGTGAFGGTFTATIQAEQHPADADGWRSATLAIADFHPERPTQPILIDRDAVFILPRSTSAQTGLEVAGLTVETP